MLKRIFVSAVAVVAVLGAVACSGAKAPAETPNTDQNNKTKKRRPPPRTPLPPPLTPLPPLRIPQRPLQTPPPPLRIPLPPRPVRHRIPQAKKAAEPLALFAGNCAAAEHSSKLKELVFFELSFLCCADGCLGPEGSRRSA